jgi:hypothetical protein
MDGLEQMQRIHSKGKNSLDGHSFKNNQNGMVIEKK